ncbi:hypothetical protein DXG01_002359 [Tephrocybe rancida]|nr:hypothetical protein DXG01_002359 [Tephrocybe rancida]
MSVARALTPEATAALATSAYHLSISKYYAVAATEPLGDLTFANAVMLYYDWFLTLDREVEAVWLSKWTGRYVYFPGIFNMVQQAVIGVILILFTWALFNRSNRILALVVLVLAAQLVVTGWSLGAITYVPLPPGFSGCIYAGKAGTGIRVETSWFMQLAFISVVFGLMIWKAASLHRLKIQAPLITILTRDGLRYFGLTVVMINRLILSVREETQKPTYGSVAESRMGPITGSLAMAIRTMQSDMPPYLAASPVLSGMYEMPLRNLEA